MTRWRPLKTTGITSPGRLRALRQSDLLETGPEPQFDRVTRLTRQLLQAPVAMLSLVAADHRHVKSASGLPVPSSARHDTQLSHSFCHHVVATAAPFTVCDAVSCSLDGAAEAVRELGIVAYAGVPFVAVGGEVIGALCAIDRAPRDWTAADLDGLCDLAEIAHTELRLREAAARDALTGLANRCQLEQAGVLALARAEKARRSQTLFLIDLDGFKAVNDNGGHAAGDRVLREIAANLSRIVAADGLVARLGGDEFAMLPVGSTAADARDAWCRRLEAAATLCVPVGDQHLAISGSVGLATSKPTARLGWDALLAAADADLYRAKARRRPRSL